MVTDKKSLMKTVRDELFENSALPLWQERTKNKVFPVIGEGSHDAKIMFIGEAPGRNEAATGKPFCGASGRVLDELLAHIGLPRECVYVTNIVKDRPPENRDPLPREIDAYAPYLSRQIDIIKPKVLATLGRHSMNHIMKLFDLELELEPISKAHGKTHKTQSSYGEISIVPLYHPAVAVYNANTKAELKKDFEVLKCFL